jgi:hypothetical protein
MRSPLLTPGCEAAMQHSMRIVARMIELRVYKMESSWQPSLMKDSDDDNASSPRFIEDDVFAPLETTKTWSERIALMPNAWLLSKEIKSIRKKT